MLKDKKILLGITGGIAAYKTCELVRLFKKAGADIRVIMTPSAVKFVSPLTLSVLSGNEVQIKFLPEADENLTVNIEVNTQHIYKGIWADIFLIAPASANTIAKIVSGVCDNLLTATVLASRCPVIIAPSMDEDMYLNEVTQYNITKLKRYGYFIIEPESGELASGLKGIGRLPEPEEIFKLTQKYLVSKNKDLLDKKIVVTAGPTYEPIDDVRFIGNYSTGKMGFEIARAAKNRGANVILISGPTMLDTPRGINRIDVNTAEEMYQTVNKHKENSSAIIMSAAVADFKPTKNYQGKIKKESISNFTIETEKTIDILKELGGNKNGCRLVGFALETENEINNANLKLYEKNLDLIVVNNPNIEGAGFGSETNVVTLIHKDSTIQKLGKMHKYDIANKILDALQL